MGISRRNFLSFFGICLFTSACGKPEEISGNHLFTLLEQISSEGRKSLGERIYQTEREIFDAMGIEEIYDRYFSISNQSGEFVKFKTLVNQAIRDDFEKGRVKKYNGWILSEKESVLYALSFLHSLEPVSPILTE